MKTENKDKLQHLFEFWWAEHMPEATQKKAWAAWVAAPETKGVGIAAVQQGVQEKGEWAREVVQGSVVIRHPSGDSYEFPISTLAGYFTHPTQQGLDALEPQVPDDFLAVETKPFGQHHVGRDHKGDRVWHTNSEGTFWCGDWRNRTPAELERECLSTVKDLRTLAAQAKQGEQANG